MCRSEGGEPVQQRQGAHRGMWLHQNRAGEESPLELPLYYDGKERTRFAYAVFCLSKVRSR